MTLAEKSSRTGEYFRNWTFIVYPDSAPDGWRDVLNGELIPWACSPLHDADLNPDGEEKKPHWHVVVSFEGKKCYQQVLEFIKPLNCTIPKKVASMKGLLRYFCHLDNPEKHQYDISDIELHCGFDPQSYLAPSATQRYYMIRDMVRYIRENHIVDYLVFMDYCSEYHFDDWFPLLCDSCSFVIDKVINSNYKMIERVGSNDEDLYLCSHCGRWLPEHKFSKITYKLFTDPGNICFDCGKV